MIRSSRVCSCSRTANDFAWSRRLITEIANADPRFHPLANRIASKRLLKRKPNFREMFPHAATERCLLMAAMLA